MNGPVGIRDFDVRPSVLKAHGMVVERDTVAICAAFQVSYLKGRLLKALSYGLPCSIEDLWFCVGRESIEITRMGKRKIHDHIYQLRNHPERFRIETLVNFDYMIWDAITLRAIRAAMEGA